jgi:cytochrome c biogenesis protein CcdA
VTIFAVSAGGVLAGAGALAAYGFGIALVYLLIVSAVKRGVREALREADEEREMTPPEQMWAYVQARVRAARPPV